MYNLSILIGSSKIILTALIMSDFEKIEGCNDSNVSEPTSTEQTSVTSDASQRANEAYARLMKNIGQEVQIEETTSDVYENQKKAYANLMSHYVNNPDSSATEEKTNETPVDNAPTSTPVETAPDGGQTVYRRYVPPFASDGERNPNWVQDETKRLQAENGENPEIDTSDIKDFTDPNQDDSEPSPAQEVDANDVASVLGIDLTPTEKESKEAVYVNNLIEKMKAEREANGTADTDDVVNSLREELNSEEQMKKDENLIHQQVLNDFTNDDLLVGYNNTQTDPDRSQAPEGGENSTPKEKRKRKSANKAENNTAPVTTSEENPTDTGVKEPVSYVFPTLNPTTPVIRNSDTTNTIMPGTEEDNNFENMVNQTNSDTEFENLVDSTKASTEQNAPTTSDIEFENLVNGTATSTEQGTSTTPTVETEEDPNAALLSEMRETTTTVRELAGQMAEIKETLGELSANKETEPTTTVPEAETREQFEARILEKVNQTIEQRLSGIEARMLQQQTDLSAQVTDLQNTIREINTRLQTLNTPVTATTATTTTNATTTPTTPAAATTTTTPPATTTGNTGATPATGNTEPTPVVVTPTNIPGAATATAETTQNQRMAQLENELRTLKGQNTPEQKVVMLKTQMETLLNGRNPSELSVLEKSQYLDLLLARQQATKELKDIEKESTEKRKKKEKIISIIAGVAGTGLALATPVVSVAAVVAVTLGGRIAAPLIKKGGEKLREKATSMKSENRNGQSLDQLKEVDAKIKRNEWWANRLGEFAAVVSGGTTGYGVGKLFQGLLLAAGNITTSTSMNAAVKAQNNLVQEDLVRQMTEMKAAASGAGI